MFLFSFFKQKKLYLKKHFSIFFRRYSRSMKEPRKWVQFPQNSRTAEMFYFHLISCYQSRFCTSFPLIEKKNQLVENRGSIFLLQSRPVVAQLCWPEAGINKSQYIISYNIMQIYIYIYTKIYIHINIVYTPFYHMVTFQSESQNFEAWRVVWTWINLASTTGFNRRIHKWRNFWSFRTLQAIEIHCWLLGRSSLGGLGFPSSTPSKLQTERWFFVGV